MSDDKPIILIKAIKELNIGMGTAVEFLNKKGFSAEKSPMFKLTGEMYNALLKEYQGDKIVREEAKQIVIGKIRRDEPETEKPVEAPKKNTDFEKNEEILIKNAQSFTPPVEKPKVVETPKVETPAPAPTPAPAAAVEPVKEVKAEEKVEETGLPGVKIVGKIDLNDLNSKTRPVKKEEAPAAPAPVAKAPEPVKPVEQPKAEEKPVEVKKEETPVAPAPVVKAPEPAKPVEQPKVEAKPAEVKPVSNEPEVIKARTVKLSGPNIIGKIELPTTPDRRNGPVASSSDSEAAKRKRKRKKTPGAPGQPGQHGGQGGQQGQNNPAGQGQGQGGAPGQPRQPYQGNRQGGGTPYQGNRPAGQGGTPYQGNRNNNNNRPGFQNRNATPSGPKEEPTEKEIQDQIKATLARLSGAGKSGKFAQRAKLRRQKRDDVAFNAEEAANELESQSKILKVTEFVTANELASMMDVPVTKIIGTCMSLGMFVSINQRLDAETLTIVADEFGYEIQFVKPDEDEENVIEEEDNEADLIERAPVVTIMGHVDHGKTSLLDYIRKANVVAGEAGGITQHIGAYMVTTPTGKKVTFLDTPGHEAFTAMRARGAKAADIAIIVIAADDAVMPQTKEAINHAQAAGVPLVFAFTKVDKPGANADKVREQLSTMNILVEDWGGKYQSQEISSKSGLNVDLLLDKVLLEAELLELKANPNKRATGTVIESALDKGRGIVTTVLVQAGTLRVGDPILAGS